MKVIAVILTVLILTVEASAFQKKDIERTTVDVLFLYSHAVVDFYEGDQVTRINHLIETTNAIFEESQLNITIRPVDIAFHIIDDQITPYQLMIDVVNDPDLSVLREAYGADVIVLMRPRQLGQPCGLSYRPNSMDGYWRGLAFVSVDCATYVTAHELGHTMGLSHSHAQNSTALLPYALGHGERYRFATIMAYSAAYSAPKVYKFSSPKLECRGMPCGIEAGEPLEADAVKALKQTSPIVASLQVSKIDQQCENDEMLNRIETEYFAAKEKLDKETETLNSINKMFEAARLTYTEALAEYRELASKSYYPAYQAFNQARTELTTILGNDEDNSVSSGTLLQLYEIYKKSYESFLSASKAIKSFYNDVYKVVIRTLNNQRKAKKAQSSIVANVERQYLLVKQMYSETLAAYQCNGFTL